ncbi:hypothetical protein ACFLU5_10085 [Bacteroidota bacterium]
MISNKKTLLIYLLFLFVIQSCYYDNEEELYPDLPSCDTTDVNFSMVIQPIFNTNCATSGCHIPGTGRTDLSTYSGIKAIVDDGRLEDRVIIQRDMPPSGPLSSCEIKLIEAWIENGATDQ